MPRSGDRQVAARCDSELRNNCLIMMWTNSVGGPNRHQLTEKRCKKKSLQPLPPIGYYIIYMLRCRRSRACVVSGTISLDSTKSIPRPCRSRRPCRDIVNEVEVATRYWRQERLVEPTQLRILNVMDGEDSDATHNFGNKQPSVARSHVALVALPGEKRNSYMLSST